MGEFKKIALKGLLLLGVLAALNFVYDWFFYRQDIADHSEAGQLLMQVQDSADILHFAESSDFTIGDEDIDKRSTTQFLAEYFPHQRLRPVAKGAMHAGNYHDLLRQLPASSPAKVIVVTMNLRSFDATWIHSKLETALQKEMVLLKPGPSLWRRFMLSLRNYELKSADQRLADVRAQWARDTLHFPYPFPYPTVLAWDSAIAFGLEKRPADVAPRTEAQTQLACHYVKNFAFQIDPATNPRVRDFDRIVALAQARGWQLVLNLMPENMEMAQQMVGKDLTLLMRQNHDLLVERYGHLPRVTLVDQMESLPNRDFIDQNWTTEHYFEHGRRSVADKVAHAIAALLPGEMQIPPAPAYLQARRFYNDCEGATVWSQMQTLDETRAHSGKKSCKTGGDKAKFGITWTYPVPKLDSMAFDSLRIGCWVYQNSADHPAAMAWEAGGDASGYLWDSLQVKSHVTALGSWQHLQFVVPLWPQFRLAEIVKVYPFNPGEETIWFDDIEIEFLGKNAAFRATIIPNVDDSKD